MNQALADRSEAVTADGLRASYDVMTTLEKCKSSSEYIIDALPDFFAIMCKDGRILKGNLEAAEYYNISHENIIDQNIYNLFHGETKSIFQSKLSSLSSSNHQVMFELPLKDAENKTHEYFWFISIFDQISDRRGPLYRVLGRDISEIKEFEKKLSQIFSAIPLGILTVLGSGELEWPYSQYTEYLLGKKNLTGKKLEELLFKPVWHKLDSVERMGASQLVSCIGGDPIWFEMSKLHFPKEICYDRASSDPSSKSSVWLGINYHPIIHDGVVEKVMIVLEDKTEIVKAKKALEIQRHIEDSRVKKILEIQQCSGSLLEATFSDFNKLIPRFEQEFKENNFNKIARTLHALKGISRTAGFTVMKDYCHNLENVVIDKIKKDIEPDNEYVKKEVEKIVDEWKELRSLVFALSGKSNNLEIRLENFQEVTKELNTMKGEVDEDAQKLIEYILANLGVGKFLNPVELSSIEERLKAQIDKLKKVYPAKKFHLTCEWQDLHVSSGEVSTFNEIFLHLLNNAVDHGLEETDERVRNGKDSIGMIYLKAEETNDGVLFSFSDDGGGINSKKVMKSAIENGLITEEEAKTYDEEKLFKLLFHPGFSSKEEANDISGRGIGLDSVLDAVKSLGGSGVDISSEPGKGTTFKFSLPARIKMK